MSSRRKLLFRAAGALLTAGAVELIAMAASGVAAERYGLLYREYGSPEEYADYLRHRHPVLGWPISKPELNRDRDATGSRIQPAFPDPASTPSCVSLYGDSFTYAAEVPHEDSWSNVLSRMIGCRVANYGMGGYGTDQAYLRFKLNTDDPSEVAVLGIFSENVMRNVNRYRNLFYPARFGFKPRFVVGAGGELELVPLPEIPPSGYAAFVRDPAPWLPHEFFQLGSEHGAARRAFPYTLSLLRALGHFRARAAISGTPHWGPFYREDHPSGSLQVTEAIAAAFRDEAESRGKHPLVVLLPHAMDVEIHAGTSRWTYGPLLGFLQERSIDVVDVGAEMVARHGHEGTRALVAGHHYTKEGYRSVAEIVFAHMQAAGRIPGGSR